MIPTPGYHVTCAMIRNMPSIAEKALDQFHKINRTSRQEYFWLNYLEPSLISTVDGTSLGKNRFFDVYNHKDAVCTSKDSILYIIYIIPMSSSIRILSIGRSCNIPKPRLSETSNDKRNDCHQMESVWVVRSHIRHLSLYSNTSRLEQLSFNETNQLKTWRCQSNSCLY